MNVTVKLMNHMASEWLSLEFDGKSVLPTTSEAMAVNVKLRMDDC